MSNLFSSNNKYQPLANAIRPNAIEEIVGQEHLFGENGIITRINQSKKIPSLILWGPAGCGKTTIAKILATNSNFHSEIISATNSSVADLRKIFESSKNRRNDGLGTILIIDEIHHFNRTQQDLFLPLIEDGTIILIAATTENPSFELNSALLSRCRIVDLKPLDEEALNILITKSEQYLNQNLPLEESAKEHLIAMAAGDGRYLLNMCEELFNAGVTEKINVDQLLQIITKKNAPYDKNRDGHYNLISALHKSMRGSDADAALYYLARMLQAGENPNYLLRRIVRFASEDIGMADPQALIQALAAKDSYNFLGSPEGDYAIANAVIYCATAPKSNSCYIAYKSAVKDAESFNSLMPPKDILNAPTKMMKEMDYGKHYIYDHDTENAFSGQEYFPNEMIKKHSRPQYYQPNERGFEREIIKRLNYWNKLREQKMK